MMIAAHTPQPSGSDDGFTLLELMVAMTLLGLLSLVLFGGLKFGTQIWARSSAATTNADRVEVMQALLRQELTRAYPLLLKPQSIHAHVDFNGTARELTFLGPDPNGSGALLRVHVGLASGRSLHDLTVRAHPELATDGRETTLAHLRGVRDFTLSYYGADKPKNAPHWHKTWQKRKSLPRLISIRARLGHGRAWQDLMIAPRIDADAGCEIDIITRNCRGR